MWTKFLSGDIRETDIVSDDDDDDDNDVTARMTPSRQLVENGDNGKPPGTVQSDAARDNDDGLDGENAGVTEGDPRETQCGVLSWRPSYLQPLATMWSFTATLSVITIVSNMNFTYYSAVITQIERRFGLSSSMTGFIKNIDNIGYMLTVLAVSHFGRYANKPRILTVASILVSLAILLFAAPHFIYGGGGVAGGGGGGGAGGSGASVWNGTSTSSRFEVCDGVDESALDPSGCQSRNTLLEFNGGALTLFVLSELFQGMAQSPKSTLTMTYMDDNAKEKSPMHFGIMFAMRSFSPMLGFLMGAWTNSMYVDLSDPGIDPKDPRWVGAWWLGFVICAACVFVTGLPLILFPRRISGSAPRDDSKDITNNLRDLPRSCWRLFSNPLYMLMILGSCCNVSLVGFTTFVPKYLESYFGLTAAWASVYTGLVTALSWTLGPIISGPLMSRMKMTVTKSLLFVVIIHVIAICGYVIASFLSCPDVQWAGSVNSDGVITSMPCNSNCSCDPTAYTPVCGSDGRNYFSPCHAGCQLESSANGNSSVKAFTHCQCIDGGEATLGLCRRQCGNFYIFIVVLFVAFSVTSMMIIPMMTSLMRCVDERDKAMSLAMSGLLIQLAGFPAPLLYGRVIDSVCLVQQTSCVRKGACLLYDHDSFRIRLHVCPIITKIVATVLFALAWRLSRRRDRRLSGGSAALGEETAGDAKSSGGEGLLTESRVAVV